MFRHRAKSNLSTVTRMVACAAAALAVSFGFGLAVTAQSSGADEPDPVQVLEQRLAAGEINIDADDEHGYLRALLEAFDIPVSSQSLVFSRTSLQTDRISPWAPRAMYFNDDVYIGWVQNGPIMEIAAVDPDGATNFYTVNQDGAGQPSFQKQTTTCLMCHQSRAVTGGVAGVIVRSVLADRLGYVIGSLQEGSITDRTPLDERYGGYYVTGTHGDPGHGGNTLSPMLSHEVASVEQYLAGFDLTANGNVTDLGGRFDVAPYLTPDSDIVALMVLTHQGRVHNSIIQARETAEDALRDQAARLSSTGEEPPPSGMTPATAQRIDGAVDRLLRDMLFAREAPLTGPVRGNTAFAEEFAARGPFDDQGRSLRQFDLETRLFRYPMSFLIYSESFRNLPDVVQTLFYEQLDAVLAGNGDSDYFGHLSGDDRQAIAEILTATDARFTARHEAVR